MCFSSSVVSDFEQVPRNPVVDLVAMAGGSQIELTSAHLRRQIAVQNLLHALADPKRVQRLHVGLAVLAKSL